MLRKDIDIAVRSTWDSRGVDAAEKDIRRLNQVTQQSQRQGAPAPAGTGGRPPAAGAHAPHMDTQALWSQQQLQDMQMAQALAHHRQQMAVSPPLPAAAQQNANWNAAQARQNLAMQAQQASAAQRQNWNATQQLPAPIHQQQRGAGTGGSRGGARGGNAAMGGGFGGGGAYDQLAAGSILGGVAATLFAPARFGLQAYGEAQQAEIGVRAQEGGNTEKVIEQARSDARDVFGMGKTDILNVQRLFRDAGESIEDARKSTLALSDAIAGTGGNAEILQRVVINMAQIRQQTTLTARDLRELDLARLGGTRRLAQGMGISQGELREKMGRSEVSGEEAFKVLIDQFIKEFGGRAKELTESTVPGAWEKTREEMQLTSELAGETLAPAFMSVNKAIQTTLKFAQDNPGATKAMTWGATAVGGVLGVGAATAVTRGGLGIVGQAFPKLTESKWGDRIFGGGTNQRAAATQLSAAQMQLQAARMQLASPKGLPGGLPTKALPGAVATGGAAAGGSAASGAAAGSAAGVASRFLAPAAFGMTGAAALATGAAAVATTGYAGYKLHQGMRDRKMSDEDLKEKHGWLGEVWAEGGKFLGTSDIAAYTPWGMMLGNTPGAAKHRAKGEQADRERIKLLAQMEAKRKSEVQSPSIAEQFEGLERWSARQAIPNSVEQQKMERAAGGGGAFIGNRATSSDIVAQRDKDFQDWMNFDSKVMSGTFPASSLGGGKKELTVGEPQYILSADGLSYTIKFPDLNVPVSQVVRDLDNATR